MRRFKLILIISIFAANVQAQYTGASIAGGIGTYQLHDLKMFQDEIIAIAPVDAKGFTYFPPYTNIRMEVYRKNRMGLKYALTYSYSTTGAHANYRDYSGSMDIDQNVTAYQLGVSIYYPLLFKQYFEIFTYGRGMLGYTRNQITQFITAAQDFQTLDVRMRAISPSAEAGLEAIYHLTKYSFAIEAGYQYDLGGNLKVAENDIEAASLFIPDRQVKSNISGFRLAAKFVVRFNYEPYAE
jgi:hypothetical protein